VAWYAAQWPADVVLKSARVVSGPGAGTGAAALELTPGGTVCLTPDHLVDAATVGLGRCCSSRQRYALEPPLLELNGII